MRVGAASSRALALGIAAVCGTGAAVAAGSSSPTTALTACANVHNALGLSTGGRCAKSFHKVTVGTSMAPGLGTVYVKEGVVDVTPSLRHHRVDHAKLPMATVNVPGGDYVVHWQGFFDGDTAHAGQPNTQEFTLTTQCQPRLKSGVDISVGLRDVVSAAIAPEDYDSQDDQSHFEFNRSMNGFWVIRVPAGGGQLTIQCNPPVLTDGTGDQSTPDAYLGSGQVEAVRIAAIHGSDLAQG